MSRNQKHVSVTETTRRSSGGSRGTTSVRGWIELTEHAGIDDRLSGFVKDLQEAARQGDTQLKNVKVFYSSPGDRSDIQKAPYRVKVVLEGPKDTYEKISEGKSKSSFMNAFLRCKDAGLSTHFASDSAEGAAIGGLLQSVEEKVNNANSGKQ